MKLRKRLIAVALAVGLVAVLALGASSASADTGQFKAFLNTGQNAPILIVPNVVRFNAQCDANDDLNAQMISRSENGIGKVDGVTEGQVPYNNSADEMDTADTLNLFDGSDDEVGAQADYMSHSGSTIVNANYASEDESDFGPAADCVIWGSVDVFGG
jgi:hypothetical protein